ncbi:hypothetical protein PR202_gb16924 [Eleusine coracana subsp. coracana]|uniref:GDSL esterase/lipase n=1 Tax=Eleusine coracana subsp. coracana TaxID=191504 RepID=A0AAV5F2B1_ELECO|nr:hypothetical protein PR202_gb16924 [Eleusine coracana subsp. coracana]
MEGLMVMCLVISVRVLCTAAGDGAVRPPAIFVFGDSTLDVGNNNYLTGPDVPRANEPYYGVDFPGSVPAGRFSHGYNIADYLAKNMGFKSSAPAYLSLHAGSNIPLSKQVKNFGATKSQMVAKRGQRAELYTLGARKFAIINVGLLECVPAARLLDAAGACDSDLNKLASGLNDALEPMIASLAAKLLGFAYSLADLYGLTGATFSDPRAVGYTDISAACC